MMAHVTYQDNTYSTRFTEWNSIERYLLQWISKSVTLVVHFESLAEQTSYFHDLEIFCQCVIRAQCQWNCAEWVINLYGFDNQPYVIKRAA